MFKRLLNPSKTHNFFLLGPRQMGKSTLLKETFSPKTTLYYDLLESDEYIRLSKRPELFREEVKKRSPNISHVFIDEIQRIPGLLNEVHTLIESQNAPYFILSGSSARKPKRGQANLLGGRAWTFNLFPLTHIELDAKFDLQTTLQYGSLPAIISRDVPQDRERSLKSYVEVYLKEEIEAEALIRQTGPFLRVLSIVADSDGKLLNYSAIARDAGTTAVTVKEYYKILEDTLIGKLLLPFHNSKRKRLTTHPKFYLFDTGVLRAITKKVSIPLEPSTYEYGKYFENWIINEVFRLCSYWEKEITIISKARPEGKTYMCLPSAETEKSRVG